MGDEVKPLQPDAGTLPGQTAPVAPPPYNSGPRPFVVHAQPPGPQPAFSYPPSQPQAVVITQQPLPVYTNGRDIRGCFQLELNISPPLGRVVLGQTVPVGRTPSTLQCPRCQNQITTRTDKSFSHQGCIISLLLCFFG